MTDSWKTAAAVTIPAGTSTIAIAATNTAAGPAGVIAKLGSTVTDGSWKAFTTAPSGWQQPGFDDSGWASAQVLAGYGGGQWGSQVLVPGPAPYLRKGFPIAKPVARARLFTTALGLHDTYLNGTRVGAERLAPGWTDYTKRLQYRGFDVTSSIRQGDNALAAQLGRGWYSGNIGFAGSQRYGTSPGTPPSWWSSSPTAPRPPCRPTAAGGPRRATSAPTTCTPVRPRTPARRSPAGPPRASTTAAGPR